ncbi:MAG: hypothetical protein LCH54_09370 [Bacteroidetes bacterium]|nr:hypothetical protein [Bacteroidota bacterium]
MPDIYQFVKYNADTEPDHIKKYSRYGSVICFDLEDSIFNWIDPRHNKQLKENARRTLGLLLPDIQTRYPEIKIAIRINDLNSDYFSDDIHFLATLNSIHTIIIPKVESATDLISVKKYFDDFQLKYNEIIPLIESKNGLINLPDILKTVTGFSKIGFGHCDYNLDIQAFPFFHQDTVEHWKWVEHIIGTLKPFGIKYLNSVHLDLENSDFFRSILAHLNYLTDGNFGQCTLTTKQTELCYVFDNVKLPIEGLAKNRLDFSIETHQLTEFVSHFENLNAGKAFTIDPENRSLFSPQEYQSAKQHLIRRKQKDVFFTFVGGCFPVQADILVEDTFHYQLKKDIETKYGVNFNVNIIRYERFFNCLEKIKDYHDRHKIDYLVFHIRPEPCLRLIKFYYKYMNQENKPAWSFNIPFLNFINPEKYDLLALSRRYNYTQGKPKTLIKKTLINLNYLAGYLIGNKTYALKSYLKLVESIIDYCQANDIKLVILGNGYRQETIFEKKLSGILNHFMSEALQATPVRYLFGLDESTTVDKVLFCKNGIHATKEYHQVIEQRLFSYFETEFDS